jgi:short-subunit dehydrogenase
MNLQLKNLNDQTVVITGASSGIGLATARMAARRGARVVAAARSGESLAQLVDEITREGGSATAVVADVADETAVRRIAATAEERYGGFDTWVNNAAVSIYGKLLEVAIDDARQLFDIDFWGLVNGSRVAAEHLRRRGGALINVGSTVSDRAIPLQGYYSAAKHAVKGFTDALRMELEHDGAPVSVTLIKPGSIDTPFPDHAKNYMDVEPTLPPPVYDADVVAEAILHAAEHPVRDLFAGGGGKALSASGQYAPRLTDRFMEATLFDQQRSDRPTSGSDALYHASEDLRQSGGYEGHVMTSSLYTSATKHPIVTGAVGVGLGLALAGFFRRAA